MPDARLERNDVGATAVEYALMIALIALAIFATVTVLGVNLSGLFSRSHPQQRPFAVATRPVARVGPVAQLASPAAGRGVAMEDSER